MDSVAAKALASFTELMAGWHWNESMEARKNSVSDVGLERGKHWKLQLAAMTGFRSCAHQPVLSDQQLVVDCSDEESARSDSLPSTRATLSGRPLCLALAAASCVLALGALGAKTVASLANARGGSSHGLPVETAEPEFTTDRRMPQSSLRFLASEELMAVVAKHSVNSNPACRSNSSQDLPAVCDATALTPFLVKHMSKHVHGMPRVLSERMASLEVNSESQEAVMSGTPHLADPQLPALAQEAVNALQEVDRSGKAVVMRRLTEKLKPHSSQLTHLRAKLFPNARDADPSDAGRNLQTVLSAHGLHVQKEADKRSAWNVEFDMAMPRGRSLTSALRSMPSGRELAPALFAPGVAPLAAPAPIGGPPPPDDLAGDICAALWLPLTHLVMASLHHEGKLTLPYWTKVIITVEDALTLGSVGTFLPVIGFIIDMVFIWSPRGYVYPEGAEGKYPQGFLDPNVVS